MRGVGTVQDVSSPDSPYVGLNFYTEEDAAIFFGRQSERTVLISNLRASRLTLLYARSGAGKSSLLRAGVAARLAELAQRSFDQRGTARNIPVVFSSWRDDPAAGLIGKIQESIMPFRQATSPPGKASGRLDEAILAANNATDAALLVILDQFEEYLLDRWGKVRDRPFASELAACINRTDLRANFLISIREDAYFALGDLFKGRISNIYGNYLHLEHLTREAAREAIEKPIESFNNLHGNQAPAEIEPALVDMVLDELAQDQLAPDHDDADLLSGANRAAPHRYQVQAPYLQLVMKRLWDVELGKRSRKLRLQTLKVLGGAETIVTTHVETVLGSLPDEEREAAADIFHHLVPPSGIKIALAASDLAEYTKRPLDETNALLLRLAGGDIRLLRRIQPPSGQTDGTRFEISHDRLAQPILKWDRQHMEDRLEQEKEAAERRVKFERTRARRFRFTAFVASVIAIVAVVATIWAIVATGDDHAAVSQRQLAESGGMAAEALALLPANGPLAMLLSLQAYETDQTAQTGSALIQAAQEPLNARLVSDGPVTSLVYSPDGHTVAVGSNGGDVGLWDVATRKKLALVTVGSPVTSVAFSPDGRFLAAGDGGGVGLYDAITGVRIAALLAGSPVTSVAFSRDGRILAVGDDGGVSLLDAAGGPNLILVARLPVGSPAGSVAFSPDGQILAVGDYRGDVGLWNAATRHRTALLTEGSPVTSVAFSPDGHTVAVGSNSGYVGLWSVAAGQRTALLGTGSPVMSVAFSPDGHTVAVGSSGGYVGLWSVPAGQRTALLGAGSPVMSVAFSPDGHTVAAGSNGGDVDLWDAAIGQRPSAIAEGSPAESVAFSPDGQLLAVGDGGGDVDLRDVVSGNRTARLAEGNPVTSVAFSPDGQFLAVGDGGGDVGLWDVATKLRTRIALLTVGSPVTSVAFSPDGRSLVVGDGSGASLWDATDVPNTTRVAQLPVGSPAESVAFSPDGQLLAVGDYRGDVGLWNTATRHRTALLAESSLVTSVAFSSDGRTVAVGDYRGDVGLWDLATGNRTALLAEGAPVASVAFSPRGPNLVAGDSRGNVGIWNTADGQRLADLTASGAVTSLSFSANDRALAIASLNGDVALVWQNLANLTQSYFTQLICDKVQGNMTQAQWAHYAPGQPFHKTCP